MSITSGLLDRLLVHAIDDATWANQTVGWCEFYVLAKKLHRGDDFIDCCLYQTYCEQFLLTIYRDKYDES